MPSEARICTKPLFDLDRRIRCIVVLGFDGKKLAADSREGFESLEPEEETTRITEQTLIGMGMSAGANKYHGRVKAVLIVREKLSVIIFPLFEKLIMISVDPDFPLEKATAIAQLLDTPELGFASHPIDTLTVTGRGG